MYCRTALPLLLVTFQVSGRLQPSCRSPWKAKKWYRADPHPLWRDSSAPWPCRGSQVCMCFSSYITQPNIKCFMLHLRTWLLVKTHHVSYSEKPVTGEQGLCSHCPWMLMHPRMYSPSWSYLLIIWKQVFLTSHSTCFGVQKPMEALALTS